MLWLRWHDNFQRTISTKIEVQALRKYLIFIQKCEAILKIMFRCCYGRISLGLGIYSRFHHLITNQLLHFKAFAFYSVYIFIPFCVRYVLLDHSKPFTWTTEVGIVVLSGLKVINLSMTVTKYITALYRSVKQHVLSNKTIWSMFYFNIINLLLHKSY